MNMDTLYRNILKIVVDEHVPRSHRGRPPKLSFDSAYDGIKTIVRTGMPWRYLKTKDVSFITVFKAMHRWIEADVFRMAYERLLRPVVNQKKQEASLQTAGD